jgi:hypothetical protein
MILLFMENKLIVTLTSSDLRDLISEVLDEKIRLLKPSQKEVQKDDSLISRLDVAKLFGVSTTTIDKWRRNDILPPIIKIASRVYFRRELIFNLFKNRRYIEPPY